MHQNAKPQSFNSEGSWVILSPLERSIKEKIERAGTPLKEWDVNIYRGILTGYNEAFIIDDEKRQELIAQDPRSAEIIRPILRGRDIKRYSYAWAGFYIISTFPALNIDIEKYQAVKRHLLSFGIERLEQTGTTRTVKGIKITSRKKTGNKWFETQDQISYWEDFSKPKIVWAELARTGNTFTFDKDGYFVGNTGYILTMGKEAEKHVGYEWLLAFFNSKAILFYLDIICNRLDETGWRWLRQHVELLPVPILPHDKQKGICNVVRAELNRTTKKGQQMINSQVCDFYELTREEVDFLNSRFPHG